MLATKDRTSNAVALVLSVPDACNTLGVSRSHLYRLNEKGLLRFSKILGKTVITRAELNRFLATLESEAA